MIPEPLQKELGMDLSAKANYAYLKLAQSMAVKLAEMKGEVTIDDVRENLPSLPPGNYLGSVFKGGKFICTGFTEAKHPGSHARIIKKWKLKSIVNNLNTVSGS